MWIDSHCHVTADRFAKDRDQVLSRAFEAGVDSMIAVGSGYGVDSNAQAVALAAADSRIWATAGVHPHEAQELDDDLRERLRSWLDAPRVVAVGECGLDYHYMNSPRDVQRSVFAEQVVLARELEMPVVIHVRGDEPNAYEELLEIWKSEGRGQLEGVLHCYTGTLDFATRALDWGFYVSFSGILTFPMSTELRETARQLPLEQLMVETDAPFLAPQGHRGRRNEPAWVGVVGETLAELHGVSAKECARVTSKNARQLFRLAS
jgi:TatD DNase family protein